MQRLIWVKKRFWFALALAGLAFAGHWYGVAHPPQRTALSAPQLAPPDIATVDMGTGLLDAAREPEPTIEPDTSEPTASQNP
jgi:hypothetical protein